MTGYNRFLPIDPAGLLASHKAFDSKLGGTGKIKCSGRQILVNASVELMLSDEK